MKRRKGLHSWRMAILVGCAIIATMIAPGCAYKQPPPRCTDAPRAPSPHERDERQIREQVFREMLAEHRVGEIAFLSLGPERRKNRVLWTDASGDLIARVSGLGFGVREASAAVVPAR